MKLCNLRCDQNRSGLSDLSDKLFFSEVEIEKVINKLHNGKSPDEYGISAEHFKADKTDLVPVTAKIFNHILDTKKIPAVFQTGVITSAFKKREGLKIIGKLKRNYS